MIHNKIIMKKIKTLIIALLVANFSLLNAQTDKGRVLIGASSTFNLAGNSSGLMTLSYSTTKYSPGAFGITESRTDRSFSLNLSPKLGYFVMDNLAIGFDWNFGYSSNIEVENKDKSNQRALSAGPFIRYYVHTSKVLPYLELNGAIGMMNSEFDYNDNTIIADSELKSSITSFTAGLGLAIPLGSRSMFDLFGGYSSITIKDDAILNGTSVYDGVGLRFGLTVMIESK